MSKYLIALAIASAMSAPVVAQVNQGTAATNQAQQAKPQTVKKRVCEENDNPSTTIHRVCRTIEVPVQGGSAMSNQAAPQAAPQANRDN